MAVLTSRRAVLVTLLLAIIVLLPLLASARHGEEPFHQPWCALPGVHGIHVHEEDVTKKSCQVDASIVHGASCRHLESAPEFETVMQQHGRCLVRLKEGQDVSKQSEALALRLAWAGSLRDVLPSLPLQYLTVPYPNGATRIVPFVIEASGNMNWALAFKYVSKNVAAPNARSADGPVRLLQSVTADADIGRPSTTLAPYEGFVSRVMSEELFPHFPATHARIVIVKGATIMAEYMFRILTTSGMHRLGPLAWMAPETFMSARFANGIHIKEKIAETKYPSGFGIQGATVRCSQHDPSSFMDLTFSVRTREPEQDLYDAVATCPGPDAGLLMCPVLTEKKNKKNTTTEKEGFFSSKTAKPCWLDGLDGLILASHNGLHVPIVTLKGQIGHSLRTAPDVAPEMAQSVSFLATHILVYLGIPPHSSPSP